MLEPGELLSTMDAKVWADEFMETKARLGEKEFDHAMMLGWFANAIMAGFDEATRRQQATIADLQGQLKAAKAPRMYDCGSCAIGKGFEQRVAQLEGEKQEYMQAATNEPLNEPLTYGALKAARFVAKRAFQELVKARADHAALLGLVQAYQQAVSAVQSLPPTIDEFTRRGKALENAQEDLYTYRASLLCQEKQRLALPMPKRTVLEPFGEKASRFTIHYDGGHPGCKVVIESADGALDAIAELLTDEYRKQSSLPAHRAKLAQGGAGKHACDLPGCVSCGNPPDSEMVDSVKDRELDHGRDDWKA